MLERLNFYDLYAYVLPGISAVVLIWLPCGLQWGVWPPAELTSALLAIVAAYLAGLLLHEIARNAPLLKRKGLASDYLLDKDKALNEHKQNILDRLGVKAGYEAGKRITPSFLAYRDELVRKKRAQYAEQFQGMGALMRGMAAALVLSAAWSAGFLAVAVFGGAKPEACHAAAYVAALALVLVAISDLVTWLREPDLRFWFLAVALFFGAVNRASTATSFNPNFVFYSGSIVLGALAASKVCLRSNERFEEEFARAIYRSLIADESAIARDSET